MKLTRILKKKSLIYLKCSGVRGLWTTRALLAGNSENSEKIANDAENAEKNNNQKCKEKMSSSSSESEEEYEKNIKTKILSASLSFVNAFGWSQQAISAGKFSID